MPTIFNRETLHNGFIKLQKLHIEDGEKKYSYEFIEKRPATVVLVIDSIKKEVILVKQWRPFDNGTYTIECVAGVIDDGETPVSTAIKEVYEEIGYVITEEHLTYYGSKIVTPGSMSEKYHFYIATVTDDQKISKGGGLLEENEKIDIIRYSISDFINNSQNNIYLKTTYLALQLRCNLRNIGV